MKVRNKCARFGTDRHKYKREIVRQHFIRGEWRPSVLAMDAAAASPSSASGATPIVATFDGASRGNPGPGGGGAVVRFRGKTLGVAHAPLRDAGTNNAAEYLGFIAAVDALLHFRDLSDAAIVRGDSKLVVQQVQGRWACRSEALAPLHAAAASRLAEARRLFAGGVAVEHVPRRENADADRAANEATDHLGTL